MSDFTVIFEVLNLVPSGSPRKIYGRAVVRRLFVGFVVDIYDIIQFPGVFYLIEVGKKA